MSDAHTGDVVLTVAVEHFTQDDLDNLVDLINAEAYVSDVSIIR